MRSATPAATGAAGASATSRENGECRVAAERGAAAAAGETGPNAVVESTLEAGTAGTTGQAAMGTAGASATSCKEVGEYRVGAERGEGMSDDTGPNANVESTLAGTAGITGASLAGEEAAPEGVARVDADDSLSRTDDGHGRPHSVRAGSSNQCAQVEVDKGVHFLKEAVSSGDHYGDDGAQAERPGKHTSQVCHSGIGAAAPSLNIAAGTVGIPLGIAHAKKLRARALVGKDSANESVVPSSCAIAAGVPTPHLPSLRPQLVLKVEPASGGKPPKSRYPYLCTSGSESASTPSGKLQILQEGGGFFGSLPTKIPAPGCVGGRCEGDTPAISTDMNNMAIVTCSNKPAMASRGGMSCASGARAAGKGTGSGTKISGIVEKRVERNTLASLCGEEGEGTPVPAKFRPPGRKGDVLCAWTLSYLRTDDNFGMFASGSYGAFFSIVGCTDSQAAPV